MLILKHYLLSPVLLTLLLFSLSSFRFCMQYCIITCSLHLIEWLVKVLSLQFTTRIGQPPGNRWKSSMQLCKGLPSLEFHNLYCSLLLWFFGIYVCFNLTGFYDELFLLE
jgi:hypothetical protein